MTTKGKAALVLAGSTGGVKERGLSTRPANIVLFNPRASKERPLKKLTVKHRRMIALYIQGYTNEEIGTALECHPNTVGAVVRNETAQVVLSEAYSEHEAYLKALVPLSIEVIRNGLRDNDAKVRLASVDRLYKRLGLYEEPSTSKATAEDTVRELLRVKVGDTVVEVGRERR